ncbi:2-oxoglutarate dehydrogenase E1 subunit family protein, partial [Stigmatella aurantiaca]
MANFQDTYLSGANIDFIEGLYARYLQDPSSVDPSWRDLFENSNGAGRPIFSKTLLEAPLPAAAPPGKNGHGKQAAAAATPVAAAPAAGPSAAALAQDMRLQSRVDQTITAFRLRGHLRATLDPLRRPRAPLEHVADMPMVDEKHFSAQEMEQSVESGNVFPDARVKVSQLLQRLRSTYAGSIGVEFMH